MSALLDARTVAALRRERLRRHLSACLHKLDPDRFRGLGRDATDRFIGAVIDCGDGHALEFLEHFEYLALMMYFLGTHCHGDPRYRPMFRALGQADTVAPERVQRAHRLFRRFAARFLGPDGGKARAALAQFQAEIAARGFEGINDDQVLAAFSRAHDLTPEDEAHLCAPDMIRAADLAARSLHVEGQHGHAVCLALVLWLGAGVANDPLFPWVRDIPAGVEGDAYQKAFALYRYAEKRLSKIVAKEGSNVP